MTATDDSLPSPFQRLYDRPGFMFRRAHQISDEVFIEAARVIDITPTQYSVLFSLTVHDTLDLASISRLTRLDRTTVTLVVKILMQRRLVERRKSRVDLRKYDIRATLAGREIFRQCDQLVQDSIQTLLAPFTPHEQEQLNALMQRFIAYFESRPKARTASTRTTQPSPLP